MQPDYATAAFAGNICWRALQERWCGAWAQDTNCPHRSDFRIANKLAPSINPSKWFKELNRNLFSRVIQCHTSHAHIGSYYDYFNILEPKSCISDAALQTREHILLSCMHFANHRHILEDDSSTICLSDVLASTEGIKCLAKFIAESGATINHPHE